MVRNSKIRILCLVMALVMTTLTFGACGQKNLTLEEMVSQNPDMATEVEQNLGEVTAESVSPEISYKKNTIIITLKYDKTFKEVEVKRLSKAFEDNGNAYDSACEQAINNILSSTDLEKVKIKIEVLNGDDSEMWTKTYSGKTAEKTE